MLARMAPDGGSASAPSGATEAAAIAVIVPILDESRAVPDLVRRLGALRERAEVLVVDGGSGDHGPERLRDAGFSVLTAPRGRAHQMNAGARAARAPVLVFLHADTTLDGCSLAAVERAVDEGAGFGCFRVRIDTRDPRLRLAARMMNLRSRLLPSATGDQAIFVRRDLFLSVGGYPPVELCEDLELVRRLRGLARFAPLEPTVLTSARRWEQCGVNRTIALMWGIRTAWHLGVPSHLLARFYREVR